MPNYACTVSMLQPVVGNGRHVIKLTSAGSVASYAPSSVLLTAKVVQYVYACGVCVLQSSSYEHCMCRNTRIYTHVKF